MSNEEQSRIIARNLERLLSDNHMSQARLAEILGVSESAVGKWILRRNSPSMGNIQKIADYFNIPKSFILEDSHATYHTDPETTRIAQEIYEDKELRLLFADAKDASPQQLKTIHNLLKDLKRMGRGENDD